jgi:hypothetical protein
MKYVVISIIFAFLSPFLMADELSQSAFIGTWKISDESGESGYISFTEKRMILDINDEVVPFEILKWELIVNENTFYNEIFPNGFKITYLNGETKMNLKMFINNRKNLIFWPEIGEDAIFIKQ